MAQATPFAERQTSAGGHAADTQNPTAASGHAAASQLSGSGHAQHYPTDEISQYRFKDDTFAQKPGDFSGKDADWADWAYWADWVNCEGFADWADCVDEWFGWMNALEA